MKKSAEEIKRRYMRRRKWINVTWLLNFTLLPLLGVLYLLFRDNVLLSKVLIAIIGTYCVYALTVMWVVWRCPSCHMTFSRYVFNPTECPYCGVKLRDSKS